MAKCWTCSAEVSSTAFTCPACSTVEKQFDKWFEDYNQFLALFSLNGKPDSLVFAKNIKGMDLYFSWVRGDKKYLYK